MVLENFIVDAPIVWDRVGKKIFENPHVKQGRKMRVQITNAGMVEDLSGYTLALGWKHTVTGVDGLDAFEDSSEANVGIFEMAYTENLMTNLGNLKASLVLTSSEDMVIAESNDFYVKVDDSPFGADAEQGVGSYTRLAQILLNEEVRQEAYLKNEALVASIDDKFDAFIQTNIVQEEVAEVFNNLEETYAQDLVSVKQQLEQTNTQVDLLNRGLGETFTTLVSLQTAYPTGDTKDHIVAADGHRYYWNDTAWADGGAYQAVEIASEGVKQTHLAERTVTHFKTSFFKTSKNLLNTNIVLKNTNLNTSGAPIAGTGYDTIDYYIEMKVGQSYTFTNIYRVTWHDKNKTYVSQSTPVAGTPLTIVATQPYAKVSFHIQHKNSAQVELGTTATAWEPYTAYIEGKDLRIDNYVDGNVILSDLNYQLGYIRSSDGVYVYSAGYQISKLIELNPHDILTVNLYSSSTVAILSKWTIANGVETYVGNLVVGNGTTQTVTYEATEKTYVRVCFNNVIITQQAVFDSLSIQRNRAISLLDTRVATLTTQMSGLQGVSGAVSSLGVRKPTINFQFDDGNTTDAAIVALFKTYGLVCGFALLSTISVARVPEYLGYQADGFEIIAHSTSGTGMNDPLATDIEERLSTSKSVLEGYGFNIKGWVTPSSIMHPDFIPLTKKYYEYAATTSGTVGDPYRLYTRSARELNRASLQTKTLAELQTIIDNAIAAGAFLTLYGHAYPDGTNLPVEKMTAILDYVKAKVDSGVVLCGKPIDMANHYYSMRHEDFLLSMV